MIRDTVYPKYEVLLQNLPGFPDDAHRPAGGRAGRVPARLLQREKAAGRLGRRGRGGERPG